MRRNPCTTSCQKADPENYCERRKGIAIVPDAAAATVADGRYPMRHLSLEECRAASGSSELPRMIGDLAGTSFVAAMEVIED